MRGRKGTGLVPVIMVIALALIVAGGAMWFALARSQPKVVLNTPYQAVLLTNGQVYFGKLVLLR